MSGIFLMTAKRRWVACAAGMNALVCSSSISQIRGHASSRFSFEIQAKHTEEMPLKEIADKLGDTFGPALDAIVEEQSKRPSTSAERKEVFIPNLPSFLPVSRWARDNDFIRSVLIIDETKRTKPRLSWYDPYDTTWVPTGWFSDGVMADMTYYFRDKTKK